MKIFKLVIALILWLVTGAVVFGAAFYLRPEIALSIIFGAFIGIIMLAAFYTFLKVAYQLIDENN